MRRKHMSNGNKNTGMNISVTFQLHPPYGFGCFLIFFHKFIILVAMATNQIQRFGQNSCVR